MNKYIIIAAISGAASVGIGAFGAHGLRNVLTEAQSNSFATGVRYQAIHSLLLLVIVALPLLTDTQKKRIAKVLVTGILLFSGSIYLLTTAVIPSKFLWFVTPLGGLLLLVAWLLIAFYAYQQKNDA